MTYADRWSDFPDYILSITREIWEQRGIAKLHDYYAPDIVVRSPSSIVVGNEGVIAATMATLAEFPDRQLLGEDVIWCETAQGTNLSSHRIISTATHTGDGAYGPATGTALQYRIIADCHARNGVIDDEWLIRDQGAIVRQMGYDPRDYARDQITLEGGPEVCALPFTPDQDRTGPYTGAGNDSAWGEQYAELMTRIMGADMAAIRTDYERAAELCLPGGVTGYGWEAADRFWMGLRASFPSARFEIHHRMGRKDRLLAPRAALRWSLTGRHDGWGAFGAPTGAEVHVMGLSHAEFSADGLRREWVLFDETAVWKQILLSTGDVR